MKRAIAVSASAHLLLFVLLVFVTSPDASLPPPIPADQIMNVTPVDALPAGLLSEESAPAPEAEPAEAPAAATEAVKIPEKAPVKPKAESKPTTKPKPRPEKTPPKAKPKVAEAPTAPDGAAARQETASQGQRSGVYESKVQAGSGVKGGSLLGIKGGTPGGRPSTYPDRVTNKIYYTWKNPAKLLDTATCSVVFRIEPDGQASQVALERSSGMAVFDNSTVRAVYEAAPYPPFPRGMSEQYIVMRVIFEYIP
jgi:periplasmic protein TonB